MLTRENLQNKLNPIFTRFHAEKVIVSKAENEEILNMYIVGCPRAHMEQIRSEVKSVLDNTVGITMTHIEAEMMIDNVIRSNGDLLFDKKCA